MREIESKNTPRAKKVRVGFQLPTELIEKARDIAYWTPGLTLNRLAEMSLLHTLQYIETLHGGPFPPRKEELQIGKQIR